MNSLYFFLKVTKNPTLLLLFFSLSPVFLQAQTASKATTGTGLYKDKIFWINWDLNNDGIKEDVLTNGTTRTFTTPAGVIYTVTLSNIVQTGGNAVGTNTFTSYPTDGWGGNNMPSGYYGFSSASTNMIGLSQKAESNGKGDGSIVSFRMTVSAQLPLPGNPIVTPAAIVLAGTESLGSESEYYELLVPSTAKQLRYIDKYVQGNIWTNMETRLITSNSGKKIRVTNPNGGRGDSSGDAVVLAEDVSSVDVILKGTGGQALSLGVLEELDYSDAPASYGTAFHVVNSSFLGGIFPDGNKDLSTLSNTLDVDKATLVDPLLVLGTDIDVEPSAYSVTAGTNPNGDDTNGADDEDGLVSVNWTTCQAVVAVKNQTATPATLYLWIDANRNGVFDSNERVTANAPASTTGNITLSLSPLLGLVTGTNYYMRLRLSTTTGLTATGFAADGEVEDHWVNISNPTMLLTNTTCTTSGSIAFSNLPAGSWTLTQTGAVNATYTGNTTTFAVNNLAPGTYTYKVTSSGSCTFLLGSVIVNSRICANDDTYSTINGPSPINLGSILGNDNLNGVVVTTTNTDVTPTSNGPLSVDINGNLTLAANTLPGVYTLVYQLCETGAASANCDNALVTVTVTCMPVNASISGSTATCNGASTTLTASGGTAYSWSSGETTASITKTAGVYTVTVTYLGCTSTASVTVTNTTVTPTISGTTTTCNGSQTTLTASGGGTYAWSTGETTAAISKIVGSYTVTVTNNGCTGTTSVTVTNLAGSVGNYIWSDLNNNGLNDELANAGINGIVVELWNATTNTLIATTATANNGSGNPGYYNFIICSSGTYKVKFPPTYSSKIIAKQTATAATDNNSDADISTGFSPVFTININGIGTAKDNMTIDAGYICAAGCGTVIYTKN